MTFPLEALSAAVAARAETWQRLGMIWHVRPVAPNHGKAVVGSEFESAMLFGDLSIWITGETELSTIRTTVDRMVNKHYDLTSLEDLDVPLDELVALLVDDRIPAAAVVAWHRGPS
ncbi:MAG: hypothetical protein QOE61_4335 [Micromonosporaceae bacterium]|nr:hypothetical protein [Micromonosporaceae bacterium]